MWIKHFRAAAAVLLAAITLATATAECRAQSEPVVLPRLTPAKASFYRAHPDAWRRLLAGLPRVLARLPATAPRRGLPASGGTWLAMAPAPARISNPLLLTDGSVLFSGGDTPNWYKLTPGNMGSYVNGTWSQIASLPVIDGTQYAPLYFASAVLPDGRVLVMGGEYNASSIYNATNLGAIYDPLANAWTPVAAPTGAGWAAIGDAPSTVLADGTFLLGGCCGEPSVDALFDAAHLTWRPTGAPSLTDFQAESAYELLPDDSVLTIDTYPMSRAPGPPPTTTERYIPASGNWIPAGNTPVSLTDPGGSSCDQEIGPAVLRPDGTVVAFGGYSGCLGDGTPDPIATYNTADGSWSAGPNVPIECGPSGHDICSLADAPAALLPNGNILFAASGQNNGNGEAPTLFFEFTTANGLDPVAAPIFSAGWAHANYYNFLVLPTGEIMSTDSTDQPEIYTPFGGPDPSWMPAITSAPSVVVGGASYTLAGVQLSGLSQGAYFGDDAQAATNYPLVRITNLASGHVLFARTSNHSTMSVAPGATGSTTFTVPSTIETGQSTLVVIANGIASLPVDVMVTEPNLLGASVLPGSRSVAIGETATLFATIINTAAYPLGNCRIVLTPSAPPGLSLSYQTTDPTTNALTGSPDTPTMIAGGNGTQSFELAFTSSAFFSATALPLDFVCDGTMPAAVLPGVNTVDLNFSAEPTPDIVALAVAGGGTLTIPQSTGGTGAFAAATVDAGTAGSITVSADGGAADLPLTLTICPSDPATAACLAAPAPAVTVPYSAKGTQTYSIFATAAAPIAFAPGASRVFLRFTDAGGTVRGSTSVAVQTD
jgi:hypothetical protein